LWRARWGAAFGHRDGLFDFAILTVWRDPAETAEHVAWAREFFGAMQPHAHGVYVNNLGTEGADRVKAAYTPETYAKLVALKDTYDPGKATATARALPYLHAGPHRRIGGRMRDCVDCLGNVESEPP
jgi:hypothetical protein